MNLCRTILTQTTTRTLNQLPKSPKMPFQLEYATEQDSKELGVINGESFSGRLMFPCMFPGVGQSAIQAYKSIHVMKHLANPDTHLLKATDPTTGAIVGYGRWHIPTVLGVPPVTPELSEQAKVYAKDPLPYAPQEMNMLVYTNFRAMLEKARKAHTTEKDMMLDLLATLPSYQGQGVGTALLRWGMEKADALQARIYLEATPEGLPLYIKHGWKELEVVTIDFSQLNSHGQESFVIMMRDPIPLS